MPHLLADTYTLYLKTHNFHWNVTAPMFRTLHRMFETQYTELAIAVDLIAGRICTLAVPRRAAMLNLGDQQAVVRIVRSIFPVVGQTSDEPNAELIIDTADADS